MGFHRLYNGGIMNDKEIKLGIKKYKKIKKEKQFYLGQKEQLEKLRNDPNVQEYIKISKYLEKHNDKEYDEKLIISKTFGHIAEMTKDSNNILVFLGFKDEKDNATIDLKKVDYASFMDLETMEPYNIPFEQYDYFCKDKKIVYFDDPWIYHASGYYMSNFFRIRNEYFKNIIELDQEQAVEKVLR